MDSLIDSLAGSVYRAGYFVYEQAGSVLWPMLLTGIVAGLFGFIWRAQARRRLDALDLLLAARRRVRDVAPGLVAVGGRWRGLGERRGIVEDDSGAAVVVLADGHGGVAPVDGAEVLVVALAGGRVDNPRGADYRGQAQLPQLAVVDAGHFVRPAAHSLERAVTAAQRMASLGAAAFALGVGLGATALVIALRSSSLFGLE